MKIWALLLLIFTAVGCSSAKSEQKDAGSVVLPRVTDDRQNLVLTWFADGGAGVGSSVSDVPETARSEVRVQDPTIPPEQQDPKWIFFADLTKKGADGAYPVRKEDRSEYEKKRREKMVASVPPSVGPSAAPGDASVIMYSTKHCPVCHKARRWLLEQKIPYVEKDLETNPGAAMELAQKGKAQNVSTRGVPVFDVGGRLVPGFDPGAIKQLLAQ